MYMVFTWPFVRANDPDVVVLDIDVPEVSGRRVYPFAQFPYVATLIIEEDGSMLRCGIQGLVEVTDKEGLVEYLKAKAVKYDSKDSDEWRFALQKSTIDQKIKDVYGDITAYNNERFNKKHLMFDDLVPFFKSKPVKPFFRQAGTISGRIRSDIENESNVPKTVNTPCDDC